MFILIFMNAFMQQHTAKRAHLIGTMGVYSKVARYGADILASEDYSDTTLQGLDTRNQKVR